MNVKKILVPTDFSENAKSGTDYARGLAKVFGAEVILLHVCAPPFYQAGYGINPETIVEMLASIERAIEEQLEIAKKATASGGVKVTTMVRQGIPAYEIVEAAKEQGADLIVVATHGHTGVKHFLLGSTAEKVVRTAPCPVLTVRSPLP